MLRKFDIIYIDEDTIIFNGKEIKREEFDYNYCCRNIFITNEFVIKIDKKEDIENGWTSQSKKERDLWMRLGDSEYKKYFLPILYSKKIKEIGSWANVQKKINIDYCEFDNRYERDNEFYELVTNISRQFRLYDINESRNATIDSGGNLLIFDYGI